MSESRFEDLGEGRFALHGALGFETVDELLRESKDRFADYSIITIDFTGVTDSDSAGLALLLEWVNWAKHYVREIHYENIPRQITAIAEISEVDTMLRAGERWTGQI